MNWVTTNIRFPEDLYMDLKLEAARRRKSVAALVRESVEERKKSRQVAPERLTRDLSRFAKQMTKYTGGKSLSNALIEMRYEQ